MKTISVLICTRKKNHNLIRCLNSIKYFANKFKINLILIENNFQKTITKYDFDKLKENQQELGKRIRSILEQKGFKYSSNKNSFILRTTRLCKLVE